MDFLQFFFLFPVFFWVWVTRAAVFSLAQETLDHSHSLWVLGSLENRTPSLLWPELQASTKELLPWAWLQGIAVGKVLWSLILQRALFSFKFSVRIIYLYWSEGLILYLLKSRRAKDKNKIWTGSIFVNIALLSVENVGWIDVEKCLLSLFIIWIIKSTTKILQTIYSRCLD